MAQFRRVVLLDQIKPSQFFFDDEKELELLIVKSDLNQLQEDIYSTKEMILYYDSTVRVPADIQAQDIPLKLIENYKYDLYDIVYLLDLKQLYKVYIF